MKKKLGLRIGFVTTVLLICIVGLTACASVFDPSLESYNMKIYNLEHKPSGMSSEYDYMFEKHTLARISDEKGTKDADSYYLGHPDSVLLDNGDIITAYPIGHGRGETIVKRSSDEGINYTKINNLPESFKNTQETPTIYKLDFVYGDQKLIMISGRPGWGDKGEGFDVTVSSSKGLDGKCNGEVWTPHKNYFGPNAEEGYVEKAGVFEPIVAMASLTRIKENGQFVDTWMGIFHDYDFNVYKTFLHFDTYGKMYWTRPVRVIDKKYRSIEKKLQLCEPEVVRSPNGNELAMIFRTNAKTSLSQVIFSTDEGKTWSKPQTLSRELTGERHKAEYDPVTGKLLITFRSINWKVKQEFKKGTFYSRGWLMWVGSYDDLKKGETAKGDYVIKLAHTFKPDQTAENEIAHDDTGYAGLVVTDDGMVITCSYGKFTAGSNETYIITKRFKIKDIETVFGFNG